MTAIPTLTLPDGGQMPRMGQGTWQMGDDPAVRAAELEALRWGARNGLTMLDTAELYGDGRSEELVGQAIRDLPRDNLFIVSKVCPQNSGKNDLEAHCDASLRRLGIDCLDLYLLHWPGRVPLEETVQGMQALVKKGKIRRWGVSNFELRDMEQLMTIPGGDACAANQLMYHLGSRGVEYDLLPWMQQRGIALMAYCPLARAGELRAQLLTDPAVQAAAQSHGATPMQVLLAFLMAVPGVASIPKAAALAHVQANRAAADLVLTAQELAALDRRFPAPDHYTELDML